VRARAQLLLERAELLMHLFVRVMTLTKRLCRTKSGIGLIVGIVRLRTWLRAWRTGVAPRKLCKAFVWEIDGGVL